MKKKRGTYYSERILEKFYSGEMSDQTEEKTRQWLADPEEDKVKDAAHEKVFDKIVQPTDEPDELAFGMLQQFLMRMKWYVPKTETASIVPRYRILKRALAVAAVILVMVGVAEVLFLSKVPEMPSPERMATVIESNRRGKTITLPCGTTVMLNKGSQIAYYEDTYTQQRVIDLSGEAYLNVEKIKGSPFVVNTHELNITVLGTTFNVSAYEDDAQIRVSLYDGHVTVKAGDNTSSLLPQQEYCWDTESNSSEIHKIASIFPPWLTAVSVESLAEIIRAVEDHYKIRVNAQGVDLSQMYVFELEAGQTLAETLSLLAEIDGNLSYEIEKDMVYIKNLR